MKQTEDILKMLVREGLISDGQFEGLKHLENTEIEEIEKYENWTRNTFSTDIVGRLKGYVRQVMDRWCQE